MTIWILAVLGLYFVQIYASAMIYLPQAGMLTLLKGRDNLPEPGPLAARADRSLANFKENLLLFLPLALMAAWQDPDAGRAVLGTQLFFVGRLLHFPFYMTAIAGLRSIAYGVSMIGIVLIVLDLL